jgi:hypothetical protein
MAGSPADPILRFLALLEAVPAEQAPPFGRYGRSRVIQVPVSELESAAEHSGGGKPPGGKRPA